MNLETSRTKLINIASAGVNAKRWDVRPRNFAKNLSAMHFIWSDCLPKLFLIIGFIWIARFYWISITGVDNNQHRCSSITIVYTTSTSLCTLQCTGKTFHIFIMNAGALFWEIGMIQKLTWFVWNKCFSLQIVKSRFLATKTLWRGWRTLLLTMEDPPADF